MDGVEIIPVVLFAYNRPDHLDKTITHLSKNFGADSVSLTIYLDGPKKTGAKEIAIIDRVHQVAHSWSKSRLFKSINVISRERNYGLANSIVDGVSNALLMSDKVIVLEDDLVTSPYFLQYMRSGLETYKDNPLVASIHGYAYPLENNTHETYFLRGAGSWGWGTWRRAWRTFQKNGKILREHIRNEGLEFSFDFDGTRRMVEMLEDQILGLNNSWAIRWHASTFLAKMYTLHPGRSFVCNIGFDGSGTHCRSKNNIFSVTLSDRPVNVVSQSVCEDPNIKLKLKAYFRIVKQKRRFHNLRRWFRMMRHIYFSGA